MVAPYTISLVSTELGTVLFCSFSLPIKVFCVQVRFELYATWSCWEESVKQLNVRFDLDSPDIIDVQHHSPNVEY